MKRKIVVFGAIIACMFAGEIPADALPENGTDKAEPVVEKAQPVEMKASPGETPVINAERSPAVSPLAGKVMETMNSGGYTYILLEKGGNKKWVAVPATQVSVGQELQVKPGMEMGHFTSKSLNRSFDNILFSAGLVTAVSAKAPASQVAPGHPGGETQGRPKGMTAMFGAGSSGEEMEKLSGKVVETIDSSGYTYLCLEKEGVKTWAAVPTMKIAVGEKVELQPGNVMTNFTSKSLKRTFQRVVFSGGPVRQK